MDDADVGNARADALLAHQVLRRISGYVIRGVTGLDLTTLFGGLAKSMLRPTAPRSASKAISAGVPRDMMRI